MPTGRYLAPANGPDCIEIAAGQGDCGVRSLVVTGPTLVRFDLSTSKRIAIKGNTNVEFRAEFLNAFNTPWFEAVAAASNNPNNYRVTDADPGRTIQFVFRVNSGSADHHRSDPAADHARSRGSWTRSRRGASSPAAFFLYGNRPTMRASAWEPSPV